MEKVIYICKVKKMCGVKKSLSGKWILLGMIGYCKRLFFQIDDLIYKGNILRKLDLASLLD